MKTISASLVLSAVLSVSSVSQAALITTTGNDFVVLDSQGYKVGRDSSVTFTWDGTFNTSVIGSVTNATLSSEVPFYGQQWTTHNVSIYAPGTYSVYSNCVAGEPGCGSGTPITFTVGANQVGVHMLWDWPGGGDNNVVDMDIVNVWNLNTKFVGYSTYYESPVWSAASSDANGDGISGIPVVGGPFHHLASDGTPMGFNFNFNVNGVSAYSTVPIPSAMWLLGSGLLGLIGVARHKAA